VAQRTDDPLTALPALLEDLGNARIAGQLALDKAQLVALEIDFLKNNHEEMTLQMKDTAESLEYAFSLF